MNLNAFETELRSELNKWFLGKGFHVHENLGFSYIKKQEGFIDYVFIRTGGKSYKHELYASVNMGRKIESIEAYWEEYAGFLELRGELRLTVNVDQVDERGVSKLVITLRDDDSEAVAKARDFVVNTFETVLYPDAEAMTDIKELDRVYNDVPDSTRYGAIETWFKKMAIAKLAGNANYEKIYNLFVMIHNEAIQISPAKKEHYEKRIFVAGELNKKLKDVLPLNDPKSIR